MKRYWTVWFCLAMAAINLPWALVGKPLSIGSAVFCTMCAGFCFLMTRSVPR